MNASSSVGGKPSGNTAAAIDEPSVELIFVLKIALTVMIVLAGVLDRVRSVLTHCETDGSTE